MRFEPAYKKWKWWRDLRWEVIGNAGGICQVCHREPATQVHHLRYPMGRREQARDLIAVCDTHHRTIHGLVADNDNDEQIEMELQVSRPSKM